MPYNPNIPQPADRLDQSQNDLLQNFQALNTWMDINHYLPGTGGGLDGKHRFLQMPEQINSPITAANEVALVAGLGPISALAELFFIPEGQAAAPVAGLKPWTEFRTAVAGGLDGYFYLAGGRLLAKFNTVPIASMIPAAAANSNQYVYSAGPAFDVVGTPIVFLQPKNVTVAGTLFSAYVTASNAGNFICALRSQAAGVTANAVNDVQFIAIHRPA